MFSEMLDIDTTDTLFFKHFSGTYNAGGTKPSVAIAGIPGRIYLYYGLTSVPYTITNENPTTGELDNNSTWVYNTSNNTWSTSSVDFVITGTSKIQTSTSLSSNYKICFYFWDYVTEYGSPRPFHYPAFVNACGVNKKPSITVSAMPNRIYMYLNIGAVYTNENPTTGEVNNNAVYVYSTSSEQWSLTNLSFSASSSSISFSSALSASYTRYLCWMYDYA